MPIACLVLEPYALWHAEQKTMKGCRWRWWRGGRSGTPMGKPCREACGRVWPSTPHCRGCPIWRWRSTPLPVLSAAWDALIESLFAYSPQIEPVSMGRVYLTLREEGARELAGLMGAQVGLAESRETALLAALSARSGEARVVSEAAVSSFLQPLPLSVLFGTGLSEKNLERLRILGVRTVGELLSWSKGQQSAFLGKDAISLRPYLYGPRSAKITSYRPTPQIEAGFDFEDRRVQ